MEQILKNELDTILSELSDMDYTYYSYNLSTFCKDLTPLPESISDPIKVEDQVYMFTIKTVEYGNIVIHLYKHTNNKYNIEASVRVEEGIYVYYNNFLSFYSNLSIRTLKELKAKEAELRKHNKPVYDKLMSKIEDDNFYKLKPTELIQMFDSVGLTPNLAYYTERNPSLKRIIEKIQSQNIKDGLNYNLEIETLTKINSIANNCAVSFLVGSLCEGLPIGPDSVSYGIYTPHGDKYYFNIITTNGQKINFFAKIRGTVEYNALTASLSTTDGTYIFRDGRFSFYDNTAKEELQSKEKYVETYWFDKWEAKRKIMAEKSVQMLKTQPTYAIDVLNLVKNEAPSFDFSNLLSSADPDVIVESFKCVGIEPSFILDDNEKKTFVNAMKKREEVYGGSSMKFQKNM